MGGVGAAEYDPCKRDLCIGKESGPAPSQCPCIQKAEDTVGSCTCHSEDKSASPAEAVLLGLQDPCIKLSVLLLGTLHCSVIALE